MNSLFYPETIAVAGASEKEGKMGNRFVKHLLDGYSGQLYLVNPVSKKIFGLDTYPNINAISGKIDLLIPLIPSDQLLELVEQCQKDRVKNILAIPSGYGEVPKGGKELEKKLISLARERNIRVIGPNILGMYNCVTQLNASMAPEIPVGAPGFSCLTQSGGYGMAIYMYTQDHQMEMAKFCDIGNSADTTPADMLAYYGQDTDTKFIGVFLESFVDQDKFFTTAASLPGEKPIIFTKIGRTAAGNRASIAHLGLDNEKLEFEQVKNNKRFIPAQTGLELLDIAKGLSWQPLPRGRRVAILTGAGGIGTELTDLCIEHGFEVPELSQELQARIAPHIPSYTSARNPVDLTPLWQEYPKMYSPIMEALYASNEVDLLIVTVIDVATSVEPLMHAIKETVNNARAKKDTLKPTYVFWGAPDGVRHHRQILQNAHVPCYLSTLTTVRAAAAICEFSLKK